MKYGLRYTVRNNIPYNIRKILLSLPRFDHEVINRNVFNLELNGMLFKPYMSNCIENASKEYDYSDMRSTDIVLDIGANVGGFSLLASKMCKKVLATEPLFIKELRENIELNGVLNIQTFDLALSNNEVEEILFEGRKKTVNGVSFKDMIDLAGENVDFLKCDCEGGEWSIRPQDLDGIRRIEMEVHKIKDNRPDDYAKMLKNCGFDVVTSDRTKDTALVHCFKK